MKPVRSIAASEFKAKCLEVLDRVARDRSAYVVTKRGRPVAQVVPIDPPGARTVRGSVTYLTDIVEPLACRRMIVLDTHAWIFLADDPRRIGKAARRAITKADRIGVAAVSL